MNGEPRSAPFGALHRLYADRGARSQSLVGIVASTPTAERLAQAAGITPRWYSYLHMLPVQGSPSALLAKEAMLQEATELLDAALAAFAALYHAQPPPISLQPRKSKPKPIPGFETVQAKEEGLSDLSELLRRLHAIG